MLLSLLIWLCLFSACVAARNNATTAGEAVALAALVVSGHKAIDGHFIQKSACAALTMVSSARTLGTFGGDAIVMMGPLGRNSPHDQISWQRVRPGWVSQHNAHVQELVALFEREVDANSCYGPSASFVE